MGRRGMGGRLKLKGQLYLLRTGQTQQHRFGIFFHGSPKPDALIWCWFVCMWMSVRYTFCIHSIQKVGTSPKRWRSVSQTLLGH